jgi:hypothetical protein
MAFEKGKSGNPKGRPNGVRLLGPALKNRIARTQEDLDAMVDAVIQLAKSGNPKALEIVRGALDGPEIKQFDINTLAPERLLELYHELPDDDSEEAD